MSMKMKDVKIRVLTGREVADDEQLFAELLALDHLNMSSIMDASGVQDFPWEKRIRGLKGESTKTIVALSQRRLLGYLEYCRDWNDSRDIYLVSAQILPEHQGGALFGKLLRAVCSQLAEEEFDHLRSNVQVSNRRMLNIFHRLGFDIRDGRSRHTKVISVSRDSVLKSWLYRHFMAS